MQMLDCYEEVRQLDCWPENGLVKQATITKQLKTLCLGREIDTIIAERMTNMLKKQGSEFVASTNMSKTVRASISTMPKACHPASLTATVKMIHHA